MASGEAMTDIEVDHVTLDDSHETIASCEIMLSRTLHMILEKNFEVPSGCECHLISLIAQLESKANEEVARNALNFHPVREWFRKVVTAWEASNVPESVPVLSFSCQIIALLSRSEPHFVNYEADDLYMRLWRLLQRQPTKISPTVKWAIIKIFTSVLQHPTGHQWLTSNDLWKMCVRFCLSRETIYVGREGHAFVTQLLVRSLAGHQGFAQMVVGHLLRCMQRSCDALGAHDLPPNHARYDAAKSAMLLIAHVLDECLVVAEATRGYRIAQMMVDGQLEKCATRLLKYARTTDYLFALHELLLYLKFYKVLVAIRDRNFSQQLLDRMESLIFEELRTLVAKANAMAVIRLCHAANSLWTRLPPEGTAMLAPTRPRLADKLVALQIIPIIAPVMIHLADGCCNEQGIYQQHSVNLFNALHPEPHGLGCSMRDRITTHTLGFDLSRFATVQALNFVHQYPVGSGTLLFQAIIYTLKDFVEAIRVNQEVLELMSNKISFIMCLIDAAIELVKKFDAGWFKGIETGFVFNVAVSCLSVQFWESKDNAVVLRGLKLLEVSITKFLLPNVALLMNTETSNLMYLMINTKLHDPMWEVRDSILEIVHVIANLANAKYPVLQTMLLNMDIAPKVLSLAINDEHAYVRASAAKCLVELVALSGIWISFLFNEGVPKKMLHLVRTDSEAVVRIQAVDVLRSIHEHQMLSEFCLPEVYAAMRHVVAKDRHWEVRKNAINFWGVVIKCHLADQGYVDGKFDAIVFSKLDGSIVEMTEEEAKRRLHEVLRLLSDIGCLGAFVSALKDDCDYELPKVAVANIRSFKELILRHNLFEESPPRSSTPMDTSYFRPPHKKRALSWPEVSASGDTADRAMQEVLDTSDFEKLTTQTKRRNVPEVGSSSPDCVQLLDGIEIVSPREFWRFIQKDLENLITRRVDWMKNLEGLDVLLQNLHTSYNTDFNTPDCY